MIMGVGGMNRTALTDGFLEQNEKIQVAQRLLEETERVETEKREDYMNGNEGELAAAQMMKDKGSGVSPKKYTAGSNKKGIQMCYEAINDG